MSGFEPDARRRTSFEEQAEAAILGVDPLIRGMIRKRMRVSLRPEDSSRENQDALDLYGEIWLELYRKMAEGGAEIQDADRYTSRIVQNRFSDYVRRRYPVRHSLANSLRYLIENTPAYALWEHEGDTWCGFAGWPGQRVPAVGAERLAEIANDPGVLGTERRKQRDAMDRRDWTRLMDAVFQYLGGPAEWDGLVALIAKLVGAVDLPASEPSDMLPGAGASPYEQARLRELLAMVWPVIELLNERWRAAFLLNPPAGCEIDVFVENGITTIRAIGLLFRFTGEQFEVVWRELPLEEPVRARAQGLERYELRFAFLWRYLPIRDALIGLLIERTPQQVIGLRRLARERIAGAVQERLAGRG